MTEVSTTSRNLLIFICVVVAVFFSSLYIDSYEQKDIFGQASVMLEPLIQVALEISELPKYTGRSEPTVIT